MIYILILIAKIVENALSTLRLIVVANGKKALGAFLNLIISLIWVISTGLVVTDIKGDPFRIAFFAIGSYLGSYIGSLMEEKIAMGSNMLLAITKYSNDIKKKLDEKNYPCYILNSNEYDILLIMISRKKRTEVLQVLKSIDPNIIIISESARQLALEKIMISNG